MKMIVLLSVLIFCTHSAFAQDDDKKKELNGVRFGYQLANFENSDESTTNNLDRFYVGILRQMKFTPIFRLETGIEYMINGAEINTASELELHYLVFPLQAHFKLGPFIATGGLNANLLLDQDLTVNGQEMPETNDNEVASLDVAGDIGAGFKFLMITAEARYYYGFVDLIDGWHNSYFQFGLKVSF